MSPHIPSRWLIQLFHKKIETALRKSIYEKVGEHQWWQSRGLSDILIMLGTLAFISTPQRPQSLAVCFSDSPTNRAGEGRAPYSASLPVTAKRLLFTSPSSFTAAPAVSP